MKYFLQLQRELRSGTFQFKPTHPIKKNIIVYMCKILNCSDSNVYSS